MHPETLRRHETPDGRCTIYGEHLKVFRLSNEPGATAQRRYDRNEIMRVLARMAK